jgi:RNA polymerase sigma-70 factor (ECF subfamily)
MIDPDEITRLYDRHASELMAFIFAHVKSRETAEDLLHDTFINLMRFSHERTIDYSNLRALLYKIARNLSIDHLRRENRRNPHAGFAHTREGAPDNTAERLEMDETERAIDRILESADALSRSVFLMRREMGMTYAEIASSMDISERTAKRKMRKMLNLLSEGLKKAGIMLFFFATMACIFHEIVVL